MIKPPAIDPKSEFACARLGDRRLNARLELLVSALEDAPDRSFPSAMGSDAELEAAYRFFQNTRVTLDRLIEPHLRATVERAELAGRVIVVHDTTEFRYDGMRVRDGLGTLAMGGYGYFGHFALALSEDRAPLGLAGVIAFTREFPSRRMSTVARKKRDDVPRGEGARWIELVRDVEERMRHVVPVHVMDRDADDFAMYTRFAYEGIRFVVRMNAARRRRGKTVDGPILPIAELMNSAPIIATREVQLSPRTGKRGEERQRTHPIRERRTTTLAIAATEVELQAPLKSSRPNIKLSIVRVIETTPPPGETPVEWILVSGEPIDTPEQVLRIVDAYRARWTIEEYFRALKTGCAIEKRQLESLHSLLAALGIFAPLAVRLLALRSCARTAPEAPANNVLTAHELAALKVIGRTALPPEPTVRDVLLAVAALGGHLKRNGEPGWIVLARGFEKLDVAARVVAAIADDAQRCDQS